MNRIVELAANILTIVGALNWGLVGLLNFNIVQELFGFSGLVVTAVYILIGISAIVVAARRFVS